MSRPDDHPARTNPPAFEAFLSRRLWVVQQANHHAFAAALAALDLAPHQYGLLRQIDTAPDVTSAQLTAGLPVTAQAVSQSITGLQARGLIERRPLRGRAVGLRLTTAGEATLREADDRAREFDRGFLETLGEQRYRQMLDDLATLERHLTRPEAVVPEPR